ncbi:hypothetical protein QCA50_015480 [Cerrena zonata]|uniref:RING-type domain-containing protein n=1 Tax=Cerrena zonata TaxID=2478898 RepID=A0AAW0FJX0_9APHY
MSQNNTNDGAVVINMSEIGTSNPAGQEKKKQDTLFGPNIGIVSSGPKWTDRTDKSDDELTPEIVKAWVQKSKQTNHATTTLQALVNLKRPTLRLSPLEDSHSDDPNADHPDLQHHHGLEFEYDCDAPKCGIYVHVILSPSHHLAEKSKDQTKLLVFETVTDGGFGKMLKLEEGAMLELGRFEHRPHLPSPKDATPLAPLVEEPASTSETSETPAAASTTEQQTSRHRKRFTNFHFRRRNHDRAAAGPALAVVDAQPADSDKQSTEDDQDNLGVKVTINLKALDEAGKELKSVNEQTTYLHVVRYGVPPPAPVPLPGQADKDAVEEDKRPWVVKVVKREATIGPHTFHLHEIYGLSANSTTATHTVAPTAPPALETHSYPPTSPTTATAPQQQNNPAEDDGLSSECLLCLSSPREVVLLPCRHLVACRECAVNMIEFGAGGNIVHNDAEPSTATAGDSSGNTVANVNEGEAANAESTNANAEGANGEAPAEGSAGPTQPVVTTTPAETRRRKRRAKGWFCPVCRQPYTSMLRITTTPPSKDTDSDDQRDSSELGDPLTSSPHTDANVSTTATNTNSADATVATSEATTAPAARSRTGFFRAFTRGRGTDDAANAV